MISRTRENKTTASSKISRGFQGITRQVIRGCQRNDPQAWETFYLHLTPVIAKMISGRLFSKPAGNPDYDLQQSEIFAEIFEKITIRRALNAFNPDNSFKAWLKTVVNSTVNDYLDKKYVRRRGAAQSEGERHTVSLDQPGHDNTCLHERIGDQTSSSPDKILDDFSSSIPPTAPPQKNGTKPAATLFNSGEWSFFRKELEQLDEEELWLIRLKLLYEFPLDYPDEMMALAEYSKQEFAAVNRLVKTVSERLDRKLEENNQAAEQVGLLQTQVRKLQRKLGEDQFDATPGAERRTEIENAIKKKQASIARHLKQVKRPLHPTAREIAELLGLIKPDDREEIITREIRRLNTRFFRLARKMGPAK